MPHLQHRYLAALIQKDLKWSPVVSILGVRQSGKTTLLRQISDHYITLDDDSILRMFDKGDWALLESSQKPLLIDEAQLSLPSRIPFE
jgi:predicted AAA+ superfamily ATPase